MPRQGLSSFKHVWTTMRLSKEPVMFSGRACREMIVGLGGAAAALAWTGARHMGPAEVLLAVLTSAVVAAVTGHLCWTLALARREAAEAARRLTEALDRAHTAREAKSAFLSSMSHEMRTPLNGVMGMAAVLDRTPLTPRQREMVEVIQRSADDLDQVICGLLAIGRGDRPITDAASIH
jgi:signal transduction histidine kinase